MSHEPHPIHYEECVAIYRVIERLHTHVTALRADEGTRSDATDQFDLAEADWIEGVANHLHAILWPTRSVNPIGDFNDPR